MTPAAVTVFTAMIAIAAVTIFALGWSLGSVSARDRAGDDIDDDEAPLFDPIVGVVDALNDRARIAGDMAAEAVRAMQAQRGAGPRHVARAHLVVVA